MSHIEVAPGVRLFVQDWGSGRPLVLVHGFPFSHRIFDYQALQLAPQGFRVIRLDLRGFGDSDKPWDGNDYDTWTKDIHAVIEALDLREAVLAGFSMGGGIVAHYAATQNDPRVTKLALLAAVAPIAAAEPADQQMLDGFIQAVQADQAAFVHGFIQNAFHTPPSAELARYLDSIGVQGSLRAEVRGLEELRDRNLVTEMPKIGLPTLICHGVPDRVVPFAAGEAQKQMIQKSTLVLFENSGHCLMYEEKEKLTEELARFLRA